MTRQYFTVKETETGTILEGEDYILLQSGRPALEQVQEIIARFNNTLRPGERARELVSIDRQEGEPKVTIDFNNQSDDVDYWNDEDEWEDDEGWIGG